MKKIIVAALFGYALLAGCQDRNKLVREYEVRKMQPDVAVSTSIRF
jgi:outer membrane murein-binding lipoprotein Lpp